MDVIGNGFRRAAYSAGTTARVGWYTMHYLAGRHVVGPITSPGNVPKPMKSSPPDLAELRDSFRDLFRREWNDIAKGTYKLPRDLRRAPNPWRLIRNGRDYLREAKMVSRRAHTRGGGVEVRANRRGDLPGYYQQNFHFQSDGWLSDDSARIYDTQVETLFTGAGDAMRRRALPYLKRELDRLAAAGRGQDEVVFADIGCGTGRLLVDVADNFPELRMHAVDLSENYLNTTRRATSFSDRIVYTQAPAERLPYADGSVDIIASVYLFHELPPKVRREVAAEFARVLRPGGLYLHLDSVQYGDTGLDILLETFPRVLHEPYYESYCNTALPDLFAPAGLAPEGQEVGFLTKTSAFRKAS
ncbi:class I SAM-dependent methyltransferase [Parvularcula dongshanensis]|uniref:Ubiquinone/menaquinone biosynthesis C-methylase UbiE n=1 Tax=Parvularcula dongshanensis TaxID=1173995 RepID=A0A840I303_9PROT|nr:class I SAM-dependent methyltransferase [Parvularcula dongshanensis]MBB4658653.1 ubiquinone/menaquinone biosynthesis C-methylase UbiE [Parvularcula dongshanensis]